MDRLVDVELRKYLPLEFEQAHTSKVPIADHSSRVHGPAEAQVIREDGTVVTYPIASLAVA